MSKSFTNRRQLDEVVKCGKDPVYFFNTYCKIQHPMRGTVNFSTFPFQNDCVEQFIEHRFNVVLKSRQLGLSTLCAAYSVWLALFHRDQNVLIIATKMKVAQNMMNKVKTILKFLPPWLKIAREVISNRQEIQFSNGSSVKAVPTSEDAGRSEALSLLIVDEAAFISNFEELWKSLYSTLSTGGRAIVLSTPNGVGGKYHDLYVGAESGLNEFNPIKLPWTVHPERDQAWFEKESRNLGPRGTAQELLCVGGDTRIVTAEGYKLAKDVQVGDLVMTHKGRLRPVLRRMSRQIDADEKVFTPSIDHIAPGEILLTGNHPVLASRFKVGVKRSPYPAQQIRFVKPEFIPVQDLARESANRRKIMTSYLFPKVDKEIFAGALSEVSVEDAGKTRKVAVDFALGKFLGLALSTEMSRFSDRQQFDLRLLPKAPDVKFFKEFVTDLGARQGMWDAINGVGVLETDDALVKRILETFFVGEADKTRSLRWEAVGQASRDFAYGLLVGWFEGSSPPKTKVAKSSRRLRACSPCVPLLYQMRNLLAAFGYLPRIVNSEFQPYVLEMQNTRGENIQTLLSWAYYDVCERHIQNFSEYFAARLSYEDVTAQHVNLTVYNFEVAEDHTYIADTLIVHNCDFLASGDTYLGEAEISWIGSMVKPPLMRSGPDNNVWIWQLPLRENKYIMSADVSRGDAADFSTFHVIELTGKVVAEYKGKMRPDRFAELLDEYGRKYNNALLCPENNNFGYAVCMKLTELKYPKMYYQGQKGVYVGDYIPVQDLSKAGFNTQGGSRAKILAKLEEIIRNKEIEIYSSRFYDELKTFIWESDKAQAMRGKHDDLVISLAIGSWLYDAADSYSHHSDTLNQAMLKGMGTSRREYTPPEIRGAPLPFGSLPPILPSGNDPSGRDYRTRRESQFANDMKWLLDSRGKPKKT